MSEKTEIEVPVDKLSKESFKPFGTVITLKDPRTVYDIPMRDVLEGKALMGKATVATPEVEFYSELATIKLTGDISIGVVIAKQRPFICDRLERHVRAPEILVPLNGVSLAPFSPAKDLDNPEATPSTDQVKAFILDETKAIIINKGVWHWVPYPLGDAATLLAVQRKGTYVEDTLIKRADKKIKIVI